MTLKNNSLESKIDSIVNKVNKPGTSDDVRFNITLSKIDNRRLEYLRRRSKMTKQDFVTEILLAAMQDIEGRLGLLDELGDSFSNEYAEVLFSKRPMSVLVKDLDD